MAKKTVRVTESNPLLTATLAAVIVLIVLLLIGWLDIRGMVNRFLRDAIGTSTSSQKTTGTTTGTPGANGAPARGNGSNLNIGVTPVPTLMLP